MTLFRRDRRFLTSLLDWDVSSWAFALRLWDRWLPVAEGWSALELGSRNGGLSLFLALKGATVVCSDIEMPTSRAVELHQEYGVSGRVSYRGIDASSIDVPDESFDVVCFKSMLGAVGRNDNYGAQQRAVCEMHRVLKPGGRLLFAENLQASPLHRYARRRFVSWGASWRYIAVGEVADLLRPFREAHLEFSGFAAAFGRSEWQRRLLHGVDVVLNPLMPAGCKYIVAGCAIK